MNNLKKNSIALTLGAVVASGAAVTATDAQANPFEMQEMVAGYQLDAAEGKCGEGKCGGEAKGKEGKCGEGIWRRGSARDSVGRRGREITRGRGGGGGGGGGRGGG
ncbi:HvfA family oxazolone/thioamide-modified RiPP metallophore, partial [Pseudoalteromonas ruthenica]|uniref:HvfA family oxazolone/thioamide-modified RiPP metallophore n=1 Tax=Pseudoalteromonas ruthenica TaxID=151081 RepID=UPI003D28FBD7